MGILSYVLVVNEYFVPLTTLHILIKYFFKKFINEQFLDFFNMCHTCCHIIQNVRCRIKSKIFAQMKTYESKGKVETGSNIFSACDIIVF